MKRLITFVVFMIFVFELMANDPVAFMMKAKGDIKLTRNQDDFLASVGDNLINKDELLTQEESFAIVKFIDGSSNIKLFPNSVLTIEAEKEDDKLNKKSTLLVGSIIASVQKKAGTFEVDTPNNVISVKGTEFLIEVGENGRSSVSVKEGEVSVKNKRTATEIEVTSGSKATENEDGEFTMGEFSAADFEDVFEVGEEEEVEEKEKEVLKIELENDAGEIETIEIEFEKR